MSASDLYPLSAPPEKRGEMLNNPTNIRKSQPWLGLAAEQPDAEFCSFIAPEYGYRAAALDLRTQAGRVTAQKQFFTLARAIKIWAPPNENDTAAYLRNVCNWTKFAPNTMINPLNLMVMANLLDAVTRQEQGRVIYPRGLIEHGLWMAGGWVFKPTTTTVV